jgi:hypothetical protein
MNAAVNITATFMNNFASGVLQNAAQHTGPVCYTLGVDFDQLDDASLNSMFRKTIQHT